MPITATTTRSFAPSTRRALPATTAARRERRGRGEPAAADLVPIRCHGSPSFGTTRAFYPRSSRRLTRRSLRYKTARRGWRGPGRAQAGASAARGQDVRAAKPPRHQPRADGGGRAAGRPRARRHGGDGSLRRRALRALPRLAARAGARPRARAAARDGERRAGRARRRERASLEGPTSVAELADGALRRRLEQARLVLAVPLRSNEGVLGLLAIGERASGLAFSEEDREIAHALARQAMAALQSAALQRIRDEKLRQDRELQIAREIQRSLLPAAPPARPGLRGGRCEPALLRGRRRLVRLDPARGRAARARRRRRSGEGDAGQPADGHGPRVRPRARRDGVRPRS